MGLDVANNPIKQCFRVQIENVYLH